MHIAFDAKRIFHNRAGLGNYSRNLLLALADNFPDNRYSLLTPPGGVPFELNPKVATDLVFPEGIWTKCPSAWRTFAMADNLQKMAPDIYHGLSHELPLGLKKTKTKSVVTIHDLIFVRYPEWYKPMDRWLYRTKYQYACNVADRIIAIGQQTADDLQAFWNIPGDKIDIVKQSCNPGFWKTVSASEMDKVRVHYHLPADFMLQVGTIEKRKNHLATLQAMLLSKTDVPLVIIGKETSYKKELVDFIEKNRLGQRVLFLHKVPNEHLPALYGMACLSVYPSIFEGFGIPVLESIVCGTPVVTSDVKCFADAGGDAALYASPDSPEELASRIDQLLNNSMFYAEMVERGNKHKANFTMEKFAEETMAVYKKLLNQ